MKITTVLIDDDIDSRSVLRNYIKTNCPEIIIVGEGKNVEEGINVIRDTRPELLLLDISMPDGTAFDLLKQLPEKNFEVIFITAHDEYAVTAFKFAAVDYLLKPLAFDELKESLDRVGERIVDKFFNRHWKTLFHNVNQNNASDKKLAVASSDGFTFVELKDIIRLESHDNYTHFFLSNGKKMISSRTMGYYRELLPAEKFCRIHHSHIINIDFVERYNRTGAGGTIILKDKTELAVSQRKKEEVFKQLMSKT